MAVLDAQTGAEEKRLSAGRGASYLTLSPDGSRIYATHIYPNPPRVRTDLDNRTAPESEITVIDASRAVVVDRMPPHAIAGVFHLALSGDGRLGVVAEYHPKNLVPLAHLEHGGAFADTLTLFGADVGKPVEVPLDELERYASQPFGVAIAPDKSRIYITCGGSEMVTVVDVLRLLRFIHTRSGPYTQDLSASANYVVTRIPVGLNPRGLTISRDGHRLFVANRLDDTISVIDTHTNRVASIITLAGHLQSCLEHSMRISSLNPLKSPPLRGQNISPRYAAASKLSIHHATHFRDRSAALPATLIPPSMASPGIWSRTVLAATLWTTGL